MWSVSTSETSLPKRKSGPINKIQRDMISSMIWDFENTNLQLPRGLNKPICMSYHKTIYYASHYRKGNSD